MLAPCPFGHPQRWRNDQQPGTQSVLKCNGQGGAAREVSSAREAGNNAHGWEKLEQSKQWKQMEDRHKRPAEKASSPSDK